MPAFILGGNSDIPFAVNTKEDAVFPTQLYSTPEFYILV